MGLRLVNNTSRIVNMNLPKYGISFILKQGESRPGFSQEYINRMKDQIKDFGLTVVDDNDTEEKGADSFSDFVKKERLENDSEVVTPEVKEEVAPTPKENTEVVADAPKKRSYRRRIKK